MPEPEPAEAILSRIPPFACRQDRFIPPWVAPLFDPPQFEFRNTNQFLRDRDRGFESISLQRRVLCEPNADEGARDRARLASGLENALGVRRSSMYSALSRPQRLPWQTPRRS